MLEAITRFVPLNYSLPTRPPKHTCTLVIGLLKLSSLTSQRILHLLQSALPISTPLLLTRLFSLALFYTQQQPHQWPLSLHITHDPSKLHNLQLATLLTLCITNNSASTPTPH